MVINKTSGYKKSINKLKKSHKKKEIEKVSQIEEILIHHNNLKELAQSVMWRIYRFEKLKGDKKEVYSARINQKYRLEFSAVNDKVNKLEEVIELDLLEVSDHYKKL